MVKRRKLFDLTDEVAVTMVHLLGRCHAELDEEDEDNTQVIAALEKSCQQIERSEGGIMITVSHSQTEMLPTTIYLL